MNKSLVSIVALIVVLTMASPALADSMGTESFVNNVALEIDCESFSMKIVSPSEDVLWNASDDSVRIIFKECLFAAIHWGFIYNDRFVIELNYHIAGAMIWQQLNDIVPRILSVLDAATDQYSK